MTQTLSQLVTLMNGATTTNGWDVVCTYSADALNSFLAASYDAGALATSVSVTVQEIDPILKIPYDVTYNINFESPLLSFSPQKNVAFLAMPIGAGSSYTISVPNTPAQPTTTAFPTGYSVVAQVPIAAIEGTTGEVQSGVLTFSDGDPSQYSIILEFNNDGATFTLDPAPTGLPMQTEEFMLAIQGYFQTEVSQIDYALAAVNNQTPPGGGEVFTPKSFVFASYTGGPDDDGVLSLYIQTEQSGNPPGSSTPAFVPSNTPTSPVPEGYTASVIFSNALMINAFLKPQLSACGFTTTFSTPASGMQAKLAKNVSVIADGDSGNYFWGGYSYDGLNLSLQTDPVLMTILNGQIGFNWSGSTVSNWEQTSVGPSGGIVYYGSVNIAIQVEEGPYPITVDDDTFSFPPIVFEEQDFKTTVTAQSCDWWKIHCWESIPAYYTSEMTLSIPNISITFESFNFFLETNLLSPGNQMISIDTGAGVSTPCDFLIVGSTVTAS